MRAEKNRFSTSSEKPTKNPCRIIRTKTKIKPAEMFLVKVTTPKINKPEKIRFGRI